MSAKRTVGVALAVLGSIAIVSGSLVAGAAEPAPDAAPLAAAPPIVGLGWALGALGVALSFLGILLIANARRAFY